MFFVDADKLDGKIVERAATREGIAVEMGISINTFMRRLRSGKFLIGEIHKICSILHLSPQESKEIFMSEKSIS